MKVEKTSLAAKTFSALQAALRMGEFAGALPPERNLCEMLRVSRPVLREALSQLERGGVVKLHGRRRLVVGPGGAPGGTGLRGIRVLARHHMDALTNQSLQVHNFLAKEAASSGIGLQTEISPSAFGTAPSFHLKNLVSAHPGTLWLLLGSTKRMQRWFEREGVPCVVMGGLYEKLSLPNVNVDYAAICRHAAKLLLRRGHRAVAIIRPEIGLPGYRAGLEAFRSSWVRPAAGRSGGALLDEVHDGTPEGVGRAVARLMTCRGAPRTWFVFDSRNVMTVLSQLAHFRARPGRDVHLLSRDFDPYFEWFRPGIAHYRGELLKYKKSLARIVRDLLEGRQPKPRSVEVSGEFVEGDSLGTL